MAQYILRLDDASEYMDINKWSIIERLLDKYGVKPIFGIIPKNGDETLLSKYQYNSEFWDLMHSWIDKGWIPAMHGYEHRYVTQDGGINPVNKRSEFAGLPYKIQAEKIRCGYRILKDHDISPDIFFAPSHTFDEDTLAAIKNETSIRVISDTVACDMYKEGDFWFIPQQSGKARCLPFRLATFCYHPNTMTENDFFALDKFLKTYSGRFALKRGIVLINRKKTAFDKLLQKIYLFKH